MLWETRNQIRVAIFSTDKTEWREEILRWPAAVTASDAGWAVLLLLLLLSVYPLLNLLRPKIVEALVRSAIDRYISPSASSVETCIIISYNTA